MSPVLDLLVAPFAYEFMQRGLIASLIVGVLCAVVGCYVVLRGLAFLGDAVAHAILPGVAVAYLLKADLLIGAIITAVAVALVIGFVANPGKVKEDTAIGIVFAGALALGIALMSSVKSYTVDLTHILFGNVLAVNASDLWITAALAALVLLAVLLLYKELLLVCFDPILAGTLRLPVNLLRNGLLAMLALTVVVSLQTVGAGLVVAMLVTPAATAYLVAKRLSSMMMIAAAIGALSSIAGLYASYYANIASGAAIVLSCTTCFILVYLAGPRHGLIWSAIRKRRPSTAGA